MTIKPYIVAAGAFVGLVTVILFTGLLWAFMALDNTKVEEERRELLTDSPTPSMSPTPQMPDELSKPGRITELGTSREGTRYEYISEDLNVRFQYVSSTQRPITVLQEKNVICLTVSSSDINCEQGQKLAVFQKSQTDTLFSAIEEQILQENSSELCFVEPVPTGILEPRDQFRYAHVSYPNTTPNPSCPAAYRRGSGVRYFALSTINPSVFFFVDVGQAAIPSGNGTTSWHDTIEILAKS